MPPHTSMTTSAGVDIDYLLMNEGTDALIVLMSNALVVGREDRRVPAFHRWSWAASWPNCTVISVADPGLRRRPILDGAWYLDAQHDVIRAIAEVAGSVAADRGINEKNVIFYGSSLGGFGALAAAAAAHGRAIAEVPQIDVARWFPGAVQKIETWVLRQSMAEFRLSHPERLDVWHRFEFEKHIPPFSILTNETDRSFDDQLALLGKVRKHSAYEGTTAELVVDARTEGHRVLMKDVMTARIADEVDRLLRA